MSILSFVINFYNEYCKIGDFARHCSDGISAGRISTHFIETGVRHEKTDLKVFVVVIPKEGWARVAMPILLLV